MDKYLARVKCPPVITPQIETFADSIGCKYLKYIETDSVKFNGEPGQCYTNVGKYIESNNRHLKYALAYDFLLIEEVLLVAWEHCLVDDNSNLICVTENPSRLRLCGYRKSYQFLDSRDVALTYLAYPLVDDERITQVCQLLETAYMKTGRLGTWRNERQIKEMEQLMDSYMKDKQKRKQFLGG